MKSLRWQQVNAWRMSQHCLLPRLQRQNFVESVERLGGIQAQVLSAAKLALLARTDKLSCEDIQTALWQEHTLVKTWAMRGTLHLISTKDLPLYVTARSMYESRNWLNYFTYYGITPKQYQAFIAAANHVLSREPLSRDQLATALAKHIGAPKLRPLILAKGWGTPLKPLAWQGLLCFGPNQGRNVTFVNPQKWLGKFQPVKPFKAFQEIASRYLGAYGPSTPENFATWWGLRITPARKLFQSMENELEMVDVEGWQALVQKKTLKEMASLESSFTVRLLPLFDAYTFGLSRGLELETLLPQAHRKLVYRPQGWISAVVLVDGYIKGVWDYKIKSAGIKVKVRMFETPTASVKKGIESEVERLGVFFKTKPLLAFESL